MSQSEHSCKAILEQGTNKGKQCERPKLENGYCGKHQKQADIDAAISNGKRKCAKNRCLETFIPKTKKTFEYCDACAKEKEELLKTRDLCKWSEKKCEKQAQASGFCGKHEPRALLLKESKEKGVRICDDGKRACKNTTLDNKLRCESCLSAAREKENTQYTERKENLNMCLTCGTHIKELLEGIRGKVQQCAGCYTKQRAVEDGRERNRNYSEEKKANMDKYMVSYIQSARSRNIGFELTKKKFEELVCMACYYCGSFNEKEVIGVDRLNSSRGYTNENCVPCCKICNFMKGTLSKNTFITQSHKIATHNPVEEMTDSEDDVKDDILSSNIPPAKVTELYRSGKINLYIEACVRDNRSPLFIERIKNIQGANMSYNDFKAFFRTCCKTDSKLVAAHLTNERKRISEKELYGYFNNNNGKAAIEIYQSIHGKMAGFKEDMEEIMDKWDILSFDERSSNIHTIIVKYRNQKAHGTFTLLEE